MSVVPDTIEPIEGWKTWSLEADDLLKSPSYLLEWTPQEPAEAACPLPSSDYGWIPVEGSETPSLSAPTPPATGPTGAIHLSTGINTGITFASFPMPPKPQTILPPGLHWEWGEAAVTHEAADAQCSCGIHIARDIKLAIGYGQILGKVKGWGRVIEHSQGWRVQYAYPSELYALDEREAEILSTYGVPVLLPDEVTNQKVREYMEIRGAIERGAVSFSSFAKNINWVWAALPAVLTGAAVMQVAFAIADTTTVGIAISALMSAMAGFTWGIRIKLLGR